VEITAQVVLRLGGLSGSNEAAKGNRVTHSCLQAINVLSDLEIRKAIQAELSLAADIYQTTVTNHSYLSSDSARTSFFLYTYQIRRLRFNRSWPMLY
jgi:hypothetical protein